MIDWKNKIGVLWSKTDKKGSEYWSGELELAKEGDVTIPQGTKIKLMCWSNKKEKKTHPDFNIFRIDDDETQEANGNVREDDGGPIPF